MTVELLASNYIKCVLRAHKEAGLVLEARHLHTILNMLECTASDAEMLSHQPLDIGLATEPASTAAKRLLKM